MESREEMDLIFVSVEERMSKSLQDLKQTISQIRTGRATPSLVEDITVDAYGQSMPLNQLASINIPEARMILIDVWDKANLAPVEKAIQKSNLNLNPQNDGNVLRLVLPELTEDRRKEYVKIAKQKSEDHKVSIRNIRRDTNEQIKKLKNENYSEDEIHQAQTRTQELTDKFTAQIDSIQQNKEQEILTL